MTPLNLSAWVKNFGLCLLLGLVPYISFANGKTIVTQPQIVTTKSGLEASSDKFFGSKVDQILVQQKKLISATFPYLSKVYDLSQQEEFQKNVNIIQKKWHPRNFFIYQVAAFFLIALFRAYLQDLSNNWFERFLTGIFSSTISLGCFLYVVPRIFFGPAYWEVISAIWKSGLLKI